MRFTILYLNERSIRKSVFDIILASLANGVDFSQKPGSGPQFSFRPIWPNLKELNDIPQNIQVEELELRNGTLYVLRQLVIDIEATVISSS